MTPQIFFSSLVNSDTIQASVAHKGSVVAHLNFNGTASHNDVIDSVRRLMNQCRGIVTVTLRNASNGLVSRQIINMSPQPCQLQLPLFS